MLLKAVDNSLSPQEIEDLRQEIEKSLGSGFDMSENPEKEGQFSFMLMHLNPDLIKSGLRFSINVLINDKEETLRSLPFMRHKKDNRCFLMFIHDTTALKVTIKGSLEVI